MTRPERHWDDMTTLATLASCATSIVNIRLMQNDGIYRSLIDSEMRRLAAAQPRAA